MIDSTTITDQYIDYVLEHGTEPASIYSFCKLLGINETDFYNEFNAFDQVEAAIWSQILSSAIEKSKTEEVYGTYSVREKMLMVCYSYVEALKAKRSFLLKSYEKMAKPIAMKNNRMLQDTKVIFYDFVTELLAEGNSTREIEPRPVPFITQKYPDLLWRQFLFILDFWIKDNSRQFEKTDVAIEKSINTSFDWLGRSPIDSLIDLGKFMYQNSGK